MTTLRACVHYISFWGKKREVRFKAWVNLYIIFQQIYHFAVQNKAFIMGSLWGDLSRVSVRFLPTGADSSVVVERFVSFV